jgi:hypothetical protein
MRHARFVPRRPQWEEPIQRAVRSMTAQRMRVDSLMTHDGKLILIVDGYALTFEEALDLHSQGKLTTWDIREYAEKRHAEFKKACHFQSYCEECKYSKPVSLNRAWLAEALASGMEIAVTSVCGHSWNLSDQETRNLHVALGAGRV